MALPSLSSEQAATRAAAPRRQPMTGTVRKLARVPHRTVRMRLTVLCTTLFLGCGTALLALTDLMMARLIHVPDGSTRWPFTH